MFAVTSTYNPKIYMALGLFSLISNIVLVLYMIYKVVKSGRNPYKAELYTDHPKFREVAALA